MVKWYTDKHTNDYKPVLTETACISKKQSYSGIGLQDSTSLHRHQFS